MDLRSCNRTESKSHKCRYMRIMEKIRASLIIVLCNSLVTKALTENSDNCVLHVGALFELSNHWYERWINYFVTIVEHAFAEVDNRTDILPDCSLKLIPKDTEVILFERITCRKCFQISIILLMLRVFLCC